MRAAVVGAGAWGTALADMMAAAGHSVALWALEPEVVQGINERHENSLFLPGFPLTPALRATHDQKQALHGAGLVIYATPSQHLRKVARDGSAHVSANTVLAVASKGIEVDSLALMSDVIASEVPGRAVVAISGPSFASEVARRQPTADE